MWSSSVSIRCYLDNDCLNLCFHGPASADHEGQTLKIRKKAGFQAFLQTHVNAACRFDNGSCGFSSFSIHRAHHSCGSRYHVVRLRRDSTHPSVCAFHFHTKIVLATDVTYHSSNSLVTFAATSSSSLSSEDDMILRGNCPSSRWGCYCVKSCQNLVGFFCGFLFVFVVFTLLSCKSQQCEMQYAEAANS